MTQETTGKVLVAGALHSIADNGIVVYTGDVFDPELKMTQSEINRRQEKYKWSVTTRLGYESGPKNVNTLYFIQEGEGGEEDPEDIVSEAKLIELELVTGYQFENGIITTTGAFFNNTLTI